ncbi:hypothetical protein GCM10018962_87940 [Dactylosporangium matsuzakiense]|uniref:Uncharacterized protein n=2 Tax=Dactylosporangium matsuzakiense TaxID=53360 RepID=A0A9W6KK40_9ACTN|nr:hypothetical protein GCM10017581_034580 [Dactylosporangium matsuzakiense]
MLMVERRRLSFVDGFWSFVVGGIVIASTLLALDPITRPEDCLNTAGNASAFDNPGWDGYLVLAVFVWFSAVVVELGLLATLRRRRAVDIALRATCVLTLTILISCECLGLLLVCH